MDTLKTEWIEFCKKFHRMLSTGIPIIQTLKTMRNEATAPIIKETCEVFIEELNKGNSMAGAMERLPALFPPAMVKLIRDGEERGDMLAAIQSVAAGLEDGSLQLQFSAADPVVAEKVQPNQELLPEQMKKEWVEFWTKLVRLFDSGLPLVATLELIQKETDQPVIAETCRGLVADLMAGTTFAEAMEHFPTTFPPSVVLMIKAGEIGGCLEIAARSVADGIAEGSFKTGLVNNVVAVARPTATSEKVEAENDSPIVKYVDLVLQTATRDKASDIHIESMPERVCLRYRVDGVLQEMAPPPARLGKAISSRIKIMAKMNLSENRPQDGRIQLNIENQPVDMRVSCVPLVEGESIVIRFLTGRTTVPSLESIFKTDHLATVQRWLQRRQGLVVVSGPSASGKTTTLYSLLKSFDAIHNKIMSVEDPVEHRLEGICQQRINPAVGLTFPAVLRATMRQAPNIIMVGELRDLDTLEILFQMAITGHLVVTALHADGGVQTVQRLVDLGLEPFMVSNVLNGVISQRLFRLICTHCKEEIKPDPGMRELFPKGELPKLFHGKGCKQCNETGYCGRDALHELFEPSSEFIRKLTREGSSVDLQAEAKRAGLVTLRAEGLIKVAAGVTTVEEILRITPNRE